MTRNVLVLIGYYAVALAVVAAWTYRDHALTKRKASLPGEHPDRLVGGFVNRIAGLLALFAGGGAALLLVLLLEPVPSTGIVAGVAVGAAALTFGCLELVLRLWKRMFGVDPLEDLRPSGVPAGPDAAEDVPDHAGS